MLLVNDFYDEGKKVFGACDDEKFFRWITDGVNLIANKADFEGWKGYLDICVSGGRCITLPREVGTVLAVNLNGRPTLGKDQLFNFHLNGPGDCRTPHDMSWVDMGNTHPVYRDLVTPSKVVAYLSKEEDEGSQILIFGRDAAGNQLQRQEGGVWKRGYLVPTIFGYAVPDDEAPVVAHIDHVVLGPAAGSRRLSSIDDDGISGTTLAVYDPDERTPQYRRIKINHNATWARIAFRRISPVITSRFDHIPLMSRLAMIMALRSLKYYADVDLGNAHSFEADAVRMEVEAQTANESPTFMPVQVVNRNDIQDKTDYDIR